MALPGRVLVVEDEAFVSMLIEDLLEEFGISVVGPASDLKAATDLARSAQADFALLDVNLGGADSFPAAEVLRERGMPFAFLTGYGSAGVRSDFEGYPVLSKPIDPAKLERVLLGLDPG